MIRAAYPDELARAKSLLNGHPVPNHASYLVVVKERPVERLTAVIPWWKVPRDPQQKDCVETDIRYYIANSAADLSSEVLDEIQSQLVGIAEQEGSSLYMDLALPEGHPLYQYLMKCGYEVGLTDRYFSIPGDTMKSRSLRIYQHLQNKGRIPQSWSVQSIRGGDPEKIFNMLAEHRLMSPQQFQNYWSADRGEHFDGEYSVMIMDEDTIIGLLLISRRGNEELHVHVECVHPDYMSQSSLISASLRNASFSQCPEGFPEIFSCRADSKKHTQTSNSALRNDGTEATSRHFLRKRHKI